MVFLKTASQTGWLAGLTLLGLLFFIGAAVAPASVSAEGTYHLVSLGPGDIDLITPRALETIRRADLVFGEPEHQAQLAAYIDFSGRELTSGYQLLAPFYGQRCADLPPDQRSYREISCETYQAQQAEFVSLVRAAVAAGKRVAMLTNGDPTLFGSDAWTLHALADLKPVVIPGLSTFNAANAALQVRLGEVVLTEPSQDPHRKDAPEKFASHDRAALVLFRPHDLPSLLARLSKTFAEDTPAALVVNAGYRDQEQIISGTLANLEANWRQAGQIEAFDADKALLYVGQALTTIPERPAQTAADASGRFYLVGMGPGDADLATLRALAVIEKADLIFAHQRLQERFAPYLTGKKVLDGYHRLFPFYGRDCATVTEAERSRERMSCEDYQAKQAEFAGIVRDALAKGHTVAMLDSGDPHIYGPSVWALTELRDVNTAVVPGLSALNAANAALATDVTQGRQSRSVILASGWSVEQMAVYQATMVLFTMRTEFKAFIDALSKHYPSQTPVAIVQSAGYVDREQVLRSRLDRIISEVETGKIPFEYLLYVGDFLRSEE